MMRDDWVECTLSDVFEVVTGNTPTKRDIENYGGDIPFIKPPDIHNSAVTSVSECLSLKGKKKARVLPCKSILITCIGNLGRVGINNFEAAFNQQINALLPTKFIDSLYIFYFAQSSNFKHQLESKSTSTTVALVNKRNFSHLNFKLAPIPEQRAIVTKIEELFSDLDKGIADLKTAQQKLIIYRQAVLKKAFEGELTKEWRAEQNNLPTADELLQQIKDARQDHYDKQIEDWQNAVKVWEEGGKEGKKPAKPKKLRSAEFYAEIKGKTTQHLPADWFYTMQGLIMEGPKYGTSKKCSTGFGEKAVLRIPNIKNGTIDTTVLKYADFTEEEIKTYQLLENDILTIRSNGSVDLVGKCSLISSCNTEYLYAGYLIRLRCFQKVINSKYILHCLSSIDLRIQIESKAKSTSGVNNINSVELESLIVPICTLNEQNEIVKEIELRLSVCDKIEESIKVSLKKSESLRQSILKKAFAGTLLTEAEIQKCKEAKDYEPASVLLKRIKKEKSNG